VEHEIRPKDANRGQLDPSCLSQEDPYKVSRFPRISPPPVMVAFSKSTPRCTAKPVG
jgi:hypothetical protein